LGESDSLSLALEDYLETMLNIYDNEKVIKVSNIAKKLNISKASVTQTITRLKRLGLVNQESYNPVTLTFTGMETARKIRDRHKLIKRYLIELESLKQRHIYKRDCWIKSIDY